MSAIAAVDYALKDTKPSCGLGTGFKLSLIGNKLLPILGFEIHGGAFLFWIIQILAV